MPRIKLILSISLCLLLLAAVPGCLPAADTMKNIPAFDGEYAFNMLKKQVEIGPRYPDSPGHKVASEFIQAQLKPYADEVNVQEFSRNIFGKKVKMQNIIAQFNPDAKKWVLLAAHWDTRPIADQEVTAENKKTPILGANDGASGVAVLLELARMFASKKPDVGVFMVFFDGEDYAISESTARQTMFMGSKYFAQNRKSSAVVRGKPVKFEYGILLDMVGDKNLRIPQETASVEAAPEVVKKVWSMADKLGYKDIFIPEASQSIMDDHIPLIQAGVKCIDIIDFDYAYWHTLEDTVDKCSPRSLKTVGEVVAHVIYEENAN